ncbi:sulfurtransferase [Flavobacterium amniphilum]|uniref:sulfurtransferase n=1 Tax=Flavobacterium amniphilum TaxID=1834035 RepID=UPI00202A6291|nr:sulfurtransferase [Flavobacterium amniphilum]MCL9804965.1 sulfurtransferase [Flavobacterium amniphilum]
MIPIINAEELLKRYKQENILIFDVTNGKDAKLNYDTKHLDGALFVDLNTQLANIKEDAANGGRHPLPKIEAFAETLSNLGIKPQSHVVVYDDKNGSNAAARFWWMLKAVGHEKVQVLNGGIQEAKKAGFPVNSDVVTITKPESYPVTNWKLPITDINEVENVSKDTNHLVIDVREAARYKGQTEPIDLIAGHIPGAVNVPFAGNLDENGLFLPSETLKEKYSQLFQDKNSENIIMHCGSGVTACHSLLAVAHAGLEIPKLYVGSWSEWSRNDKPVETSAS